MTTLDDFFLKPLETLPPRLRDWKRRLGEPGASLVIEAYLPENDLGHSPPELNLQFTNSGTMAPLETVPWDDDLNAGLIGMGVKSATPANEAERFSLGLRAALRKSERDFGDGFFNAVLMELLRDSDLTRHDEIAAVAGHIYEYVHPIRAHDSGGASSGRNRCRESIADAIAGRARELRDALGYPQETAKGILVSAIAHYLDRRFSIGSRRRLGLL